MLTTVTLTGADASVDPADLAALSDEFPFVEWGILIGSGFGNRFPSLGWIRELTELSGDRKMRLNLSLHICGKHLRAIAAGKPDLKDVMGFSLYYFQRCQLNWHGERQGDIGEKILGSFCALQPWEPTVIFQFDGVNDHLWKATARRLSCVALFDRSHGDGVLPDQWHYPSFDLASGWAGGLGPDNVVAEHAKIASVAYPALHHWIDMETKLRATDDDYFDLGKCRKVLELMRPFVT